MTEVTCGFGARMIGTPHTPGLTLELGTTTHSIAQYAAGFEPGGRRFFGEFLRSLTDVELTGDPRFSNP